MAIETAPSQVPAPATANVEISEEGLEKLSEEERKLHRLLVPKHKRSAIPLSKFEGLYDPAMISADAAYVERMERKFREDEKPELAHFQRRAELLEALMREEIKSAGWLGEEANPITASRYDDIKNGVDLVVEFLKKEGVNRLALSVDVTSNVTSLEEKLQKIKGDILEGHLTQVKYFVSSDGNRQEIKNVPRVVIGIESHVIKELSELRLEIHVCAQALMNNKESRSLSPETAEWYRTRGIQAKEKLTGHRIQMLILDEIEMQITSFMKFAGRNGQDQLVEEYEKTAGIIRDLRESKHAAKEGGNVSVSNDEEFANANDGVFRALQMGLKIFE